MSRTTKDKPEKVLWPWYFSDSVKKTKKKKRENTEWDWLGATPSWWNNMFHTRPRRNRFHLLEKNIVKTRVDDLDDVDYLEDINKPHKYYY